MPPYSIFERFVIALAFAAATIVALAVPMAAFAFVAFIATTLAWAAGYAPGMSIVNVGLILGFWAGVALNAGIHIKGARQGATFMDTVIKPQLRDYRIARAREEAKRFVARARGETERFIASAG